MVAVLDKDNFSASNLKARAWSITEILSDEVFSSIATDEHSAWASTHSIGDDFLVHLTRFIVGFEWSLIR